MDLPETRQIQAITDDLHKYLLRRIILVLFELE